MGRPTHPSAL